MLAWKQLAKNYRDAFQQALEYIQELSEQEAKIVRAAKAFKTVSEKRGNPYVPLVGGKDINIEKAKENLFKVLEDYEIIM